MEDNLMSVKTIFDYARAAAQAEQQIIELLDIALQDDIEVEERSKTDLRNSAQPRQGQESSG
jgi:hypothetical protein